MKDMREEIICEILRVAKAIEPEPLTKQAFQREAHISTNKVRYHFGTWNEAIRAAGLKLNEPGFAGSSPSTLPDDELLTEIGRLWKHMGKPPT